MNIKFDKRLIERNLRKGLITREEYQAHLDSLKDREAQAARVEARLEAVFGVEADDDDDDDDDLDSEEEL